MQVDGVSFCEKDGYVVRSTHKIPMNMVSTDNATVKDGVGSTEERVLSLHTEPPGCRIHCRKVSSGMRV